MDFITDLLFDGFRFRGPGHQITWSAEGDWSGAQVEKLLRSYGVAVWARRFPEYTKGPDGEKRPAPGAWFGLTVSRKQAKWACTLMLTVGVPVLTGMVEGIRPMASLPKTSWDSTASRTGLGSWLNDLFVGRPRAANTVKGRRKGKRRGR